MLKEELQKRFEEIYGSGGEIRVFFAPGRVNLIGEHIDYYGGHVYTFAMKQGTYCAARLRPDRTVQVASDNYDGGRVHGFLLDSIPSIKEDPAWLRYAHSVLRMFEMRGCFFPQGVDVLYSGDLPIGVGLASSASIQVVTAKMLLELGSFSGMSQVELAGLCQEAEQEYVCVSSGIHDHLTSVLGKKDYGVMIAAQKLQYEYVPLRLGTSRVILADSMVRYKEHYGEYTIRREECGKALKRLKVVANIDQLCDLSVDTFNNCKDVIMNDVYTKRARHAVTENARAIRAVSAVRVGNIRRFGELMYLSHESLRDDYEVSCPELDFLVEVSRNIPGVYGSRMMGEGFGGCIVSIVEEDAVDAYKASIAEAYLDRYHTEPRFYDAEACDGAREL